MTSPPDALARQVPLAPLTTLKLGGQARFFLAAQQEQEILEGLRWAAAEGLPVALLGAGSNVVVADEGFPGLVIQLATRGIEVRREGDTVLLTVAAGEPWDEVVALAVAKGWAGIECLSGIPGTTGATPMQNVGAYGQEVGEVLRQVRVLRRHTLTVETWSAAQLQLGYRTSRLRREPGSFVVLAVTLALTPGGRPTLCYPELITALTACRGTPSLAQVRETVLALRRGKSMLLDPADPDSRSVGSFFINPVVPRRQFETVAKHAWQVGCVPSPADVPGFPLPGDLIKIPAAWLVEQAGFPRGFRRGAVGLSRHHALALVHHGGGTSRELLALAQDISQAVYQRFGVVLVTEPTSLDSSPLHLAEPFPSSPRHTS